MNTRRQFLSVSATLAAASQLAPHSFAADSDRKLGFALVGLGRLSTNQIAPALQKTKNCKLAGIVTGSPEKAEAWQKQYGISQKSTYNYRNFDQIADNPDIDVVYVVLPNSMHEEFTIRAARAGKHVLCEKPMSVSVAEAKQMTSECEKAKVKLAIGYRCQFEPHHIECMRMAKEKRFGAIRQIDASFGFRFGDYPLGDLRRWRLEMEYAGGGALMDVGIYALQACRYLTGEEPKSVMAREIKTDHEKFAEVDETILWSMDFPSGIVANCSTTYGFSGMNQFTAYADNGKFGMEPAFSYEGNRAFAGNSTIEKPQIDQFAAEMDDFANVIRTDSKSKVSGEEGLRDMIVMDAIYKSVASGKSRKIS
ncbi:MAG: Gfo/Idh/MocA family oxidoreductase [Planctomycetales bacterium]|nr:Gfo/Idh/MocA family oxidoreductase [Planctomycetales bacterium]